MNTHKFGLTSLSGGVFLLVLIAGCTVNERITKRSEVWVNAYDRKPIKVLTIDGTVYVLQQYTLTDTSLVGSGFTGSQGYTGEIPLARIRYLQSSHTSFWKSVAGAGAIGLFLASTVPALESADFSVTPKEGYHPPYTGGYGGGSCPFVYSWDGERYILEGEAFSVALGKSLEVSTSTVLASMRPTGSELRLKLSNERPETHHFNEVRMDVVEADENTLVVLDPENRAWPVNALSAPIVAKTSMGNDVTRYVDQADGKYWESELSRLREHEFRDRIEFTFGHPDGATEGTLVIEAMNTRLSNAVFAYLFRFLGDQALAFLQAVEQDPELISILQNWILESALKIRVWNGTEWEQAGAIIPEANEIGFSRALRIRVPRSNQHVRIQLECLADVWKLDAVRIDWTSVVPLEKREVRLVSAIGPTGENVRKAIADPDDEYSVLFPPQSLDVRFEAPDPPHPGKKHVFIANVRGYLYEWITPTDSGITAASGVAESMKVPFLKVLLQNKDLFLGPVYAEWKMMKE